MEVLRQDDIEMYTLEVQKGSSENKRSSFFYLLLTEFYLLDSPYRDPLLCHLFDDHRLDIHCFVIGYSRLVTLE